MTDGNLGDRFHIDSQHREAMTTAIHGMNVDLSFASRDRYIYLLVLWASRQERGPGQQLQDVIRHM